jgi:hypothetical protein
MGKSRSSPDHGNGIGTRAGAAVGFCAILLPLLLIFVSPLASAQDAEGGSPEASEPPMDNLPDIRDDETVLKVQKGDLVVVPIPMSSPTFGTGLILGGAYFYPQTPEQKKSQPASFTGAGAAYTNNDSWAVGVIQQNYWDADKWRFTGIAGLADFKFELRDPATDGESDLDWLVAGGFIQGTISRRIGGDWYAGVLGRYLDITQDLVTPSSGLFLTGSNIKSVGAGLTAEFDTRDLPTNAYTGRRFEGKAIFSNAEDEETSSYQGYYLRYRNYHQLTKAPIVVAWDINGCAKSGKFPLWDTCRINLRGFPLTDYLGKQSISGQIEARWRASSKWGFVGFAGAGHISDSFSASGDNEGVPSYGAGVRYMVLKSKRVNVRVDYARSDASDAWYLGVGEAF